MNRDDIVSYRWLVLGLVVSTTAAATVRLWAIFQVDGLSAVEILLLGLFALLFSWIAVSFWMACLGAHAFWRGSAPPSRFPSAEGPMAGSRSRTVLVMPICNEDCAEVFARVQAMEDSLREIGRLDGFDFFLLSDSSDPACCAAEEAGWRWLRRRGGNARIFYRRRRHRTGRKAGNIAEFCENWGAAYDYLVVLDADSLMTGVTLVRLVEMMDENPRAALIQVPPLLVGGKSLFARTQQFASWVYGRMYAAGLAKLQGADGNYWGHNAIIRVRPFMQNCGLPMLPGRPPLGGEIMSHDFVEAALLRRAGWEVWLTTELDGSYEAPPPTLIDHLKRDRRWCQGNLQHIKLLFAQGLHPWSRLHLAFGVMTYLSSPLWLLLIILFSVDTVQLQQSPVTYIGRYPVLTWPITHTLAFVSLAMATVGLLLGPKVLALIVLLRDARAVRLYGGARRLIVGVLIESALSTLLAPIFMLSHSWFVFTILIGRSSGWGAQARGTNGVSLRSAARAFAPHTIIAVGVGLAIWHWVPATFWLYLPLLVGPALAIPLCWVTSDPSRGAAARRDGMFVVPSEQGTVGVLDRFDALLAESSRADAFIGPNADRNGDSLQVA